MQNTPQAFRGAGAPGVNFSEHTYDNHINTHCQPSGYQQYSNPPYHHPSPRPHHYGNHHIPQQQNMPYRHHSGGGYPSNHNQYNQGMNQDMYRNHHYPRNMPTQKPWSENSPDMMSSYGQAPHGQQPMSMVNNQQQPVPPIQSPPHATTNMPSGQQHYRQSPVHSPHAWSPAQMPSPMHQSPTPSPLSAHSRSPGHSQPFSPPMSMTSDQNGQMSANINATGSGDPLHSLQKMVMLDSESKSMLPLISDASESFPDQCNPLDYMPDDMVVSEPTTYYNMDGNRFEPKGNAPIDSTGYQQVPNCNYPPPQVQNAPPIPHMQCDQPQHPMPSPVNSLPPQQSHLPPAQNDGAVNLEECPPHAESAPVFTDQTKAAISTNSEQALAIETGPDWAQSPMPIETENRSSLPSPASAPLPSSTSMPSPSSHDNTVSQVPDAQLKCDMSPPVDSQSPSNSLSENNTSMSNDNTAEDRTLSEEGTCSNPQNEVQIECEKGSVEEHLESCSTSSEGKPVLEVSDENSDSLNASDAKPCHEEDAQEPVIKQENVESVVDVPSSENETKNLPSILDTKDNVKESPKSEDSPSSQCPTNSIKVEIHPIRESETEKSSSVPEEPVPEAPTPEDKIESKPLNVGPQILIESPPPQKQLGARSSLDSNSVITIKDDTGDEIEILDSSIPSTSTPSQPKKRIRRRRKLNSDSCSSPDKKRGRPVGSRNKTKPDGTSSVKRKRVRKGSKKKEEVPRQKTVDAAAAKSKKVKVFSGPYVHLVGNRNKPSAISVVNVAQKEEEKVKVVSKRSFSNPPTNRVKSKKTVGHLSTLSPTYDAFNRDKTWLCVFCRKGSHFSGLGDLYGPYYVKCKIPESTKLSSASTSGSSRKSQTSSTKKRKAEHDDTRASKRSKQASGHSADSTPKKGQQAGDLEVSDQREVWIHEDCAIWCQTVSLIGEEVQGLEEAITEASENICCHCNLPGATVGCWGKACKERYHYSCAKHIGCQMDLEQFSLFCPKHQKKISPEKMPSKTH